MKIESIKISSIAPIINESVRYFSGTRFYLSTGALDVSKVGNVEKIDFSTRPSRADLTARSGDIIFARMKGTNKVLIIDEVTSNYIFSTGFMILRPSDKVFSGYLFHYLTSSIFQSAKDRLCTGATQQAINNAKFTEIEIPLPTYAEQIHIAKILDKAKNILESQKSRLECYEKLIESVFNKMFAKPSNSWPQVKLSTLAYSQKGSMRTGPFGSDLLHSEFVSSGVYVLGIDNVVNNKFESTGTRYITKEKYSDLKRYKIFPNDVLITIMGTTGRTAVVPQNIPEAINTKHLVAITLNTEIANPYFISFSLRSDPKILSQIQSKQRGAIMNGLNLGLIKDLNIVLPAIGIQNKFGSIFQNIENQKEITEKALITSRNLFDNLTQKAFKGELSKIKELA